MARSTLHPARRRTLIVYAGMPAIEASSLELSARPCSMYLRLPHPPHDAVLSLKTLLTHDGYDTAVAQTLPPSCGCTFPACQFDDR